MKSKLAVLIFTLCTLSGCAVMDKQECESADWYLLGLGDGNSGKPLAQLTERNEACASYGFSANRGEYLRGRLDGLRTYCTPQKGYQAGVGGSHYHGVCNAQSEPTFLVAYRQGKALYEKKRAVRDWDNKIRRLEREIIRKKEERDKIESDLIGASTAEARARLLLRLKTTNQRISEAQHKLKNLRKRRAEAKRALARTPQHYVP